MIIIQVKVSETLEIKRLRESAVIPKRNTTVKPNAVNNMLLVALAETSQSKYVRHIQHLLEIEVVKNFLLGANHRITVGGFSRNSRKVSEL